MAELRIQARINRIRIHPETCPDPNFKKITGYNSSETMNTNLIQKEKKNLFVDIQLLGDPEVTANLYCYFACAYWEGCVICSKYLRSLLGHSVYIKVHICTMYTDVFDISLTYQFYSSSYVHRSSPAPTVPTSNNI